MPVEDRSRLTSGYGYQQWRGYTHTGVDFGGTSPGVSSPVYAAADGVVEIAADGTIPLRTGPQIKIRHADGTASTYGHTRRCKVKRGQVVRRRDRLADSWHTGLKASAGIHLHLEHWTDSDDPDTHHDPTQWLAANGWTIRDGRLYDDGPPTLTLASTVSASTPTSAPTTFQEEDTMLFIWGRTRGRILSGGTFAGVPHSVIVNAQKVGIPVIALDNEAHATLTRDFADRTQKVALDEEEDD